MDYIACALIIFLAACGLIWLIYGCLLGRFLSSKDDSTYILVPVNENTKDLDIRLYDAKHQLKRIGGKSDKKIIILDNGMSEMMRGIAQKEAEDNPDIYLMQANELQKLE